MEAAKALLPAIIGFFLSIIGAFIKHTLDKDLEVKKIEENARLARERAEKDAKLAREQELRLKQQENYKKLLSSLSSFMYGKSDTGLVDAHLESMAFSDPEVVISTRKLLKSVGTENIEEDLLEFLKLIRSKSFDVEEGEDEIWDKYDVDLIFPETRIFRRK